MKKMMITIYIRKWKKCLIQLGILSVMCFLFMMPETIRAEETDTDSSLVAIYGDSLSTYEGTTPYATYYYHEGILAQNEIWWGRLIEYFGWTLGENASLGGSRVTYSGEINYFYHLGHEFSMSSDERIAQLDDKGTPDIILFFGGLNDEVEPSVPAGELSNLTYGDVGNFAGAYYTTLIKLQNAYPKAQIIAVIPYKVDVVTEKRYQTFTAIMRNILEMKGIPYVDLSQVSMGKDTIMEDEMHINSQGMAKIAEAAVPVVEQRLSYISDAALSEAYITMTAGDTAALDFFCQVHGTGNWVLEWSNSNPSVVKMEQYGTRVILTPLQTGSTVLTAQVGNVKQSCFIRIGKQAPEAEEWCFDENGELCYYDADCEKVRNQFMCDGLYTYYLQNDGTAMSNRLTYHPDGVHLIYLDEYGRESFDQFHYCADVGYTCYFNTFGYAIYDQVTFLNEQAYYLDLTGRRREEGWFLYENGFDIGYASADGSLVTNGFGNDAWGRTVFFQWNGKLARGLISDGLYFYRMDAADGHCIEQFPCS